MLSFFSKRIIIFGQLSIFRSTSQFLHLYGGDCSDCSSGSESEDEQYVPTAAEMKSWAQENPPPTNNGFLIVQCAAWTGNREIGSGLTFIRYQGKDEVTKTWSKSKTGYLCVKVCAKTKQVEEKVFDLFKHRDAQMSEMAKWLNGFKPSEVLLMTMVDTIFRKKDAPLKPSLLKILKRFGYKHLPSYRQKFIFAGYLDAPAKDVFHEISDGQEILRFSSKVSLKNGKVFLSSKSSMRKSFGEGVDECVVQKKVNSFPKAKAKAASCVMEFFFHF